MPRIYLSNDASDVSATYKQAYVDMRSPNTTALTLSTTTTTGSGDDIQATDTAGGNALAWITPPLGAAVTLATKVFINIWAKETSAAANCTVAVTLTLYTAAAESTVFLDDDAFTTELTTSFAANRYASTAVTSQAFAAGDRLVIKIYASAVGTMGAVTGGFLVDYDGPTEGSDGDSYLDIQEPFRVNKMQFGAGTAPLDPSSSDGHLTRGIDTLNDYVGRKFFPMNCTIRKAIDQLTFERNLLSPVTKQVIPT